MAGGGAIRVFDFEVDVNGARVVVREPLHGGCLSDAEIDANIGLLKENLDRVGLGMKRAIRKQRAKPWFGE